VAEAVAAAAVGSAAAAAARIEAAPARAHPIEHRLFTVNEFETYDRAFPRM
jgi:hypothetical protein